MNYFYRENDKYKLTREGGNFSRSGEDMLSFISEILPGDREDALQLLENGFIMIESLTNNITEKIVKLSHHYKRLKKLDYDQFILVMGDPDKSALLNRAIPLTMGYEGYWYKLNELGQTILKRKNDTLRGTRWLDHNAVKLLAEKIVEKNPEIESKIEHLLE